MSDIGTAYERSEAVESRIWNQIAYVGRYGNQPISELKRLTLRELDRLARSVAKIVSEENDAGKFSHDMG